MGSLILLLIVTTKRIRAAAIEKARQAAVVEVVEPEVIAPVIESLAVPVDVNRHENAIRSWRTQLESLTAERDSTREALTDLERKLVAAQSAVLRSQQTATSKKDRLKEARGIQQKAAVDRERLQGEIEAMRDELAVSEQRLADAKERQKTAQSKFAFIPFDGRNGTTRRPILIECTDKFIRFVPEDIRLTPAELNGFTAGFNPLLNASRELIHYWNAYDRVHAEEAASEAENSTDEVTNKDLLSFGNSTKEPYVLLLVRPTGAMSFLIAKNLLGQLKIPHGYELLDDDMELEFSDPNPDAKQICQQAITQTLNERENVLQLVATNRNLQRDQLQLEPNSQSFVPVENPEPSTPSFGSRSSNNSGLPTNRKTAASTGSDSATGSNFRDQGTSSLTPQPNSNTTRTGSGVASADGEARNSIGDAYPSKGGTKPPVGDRARSGKQRPESEFVQADTDNSPAGSAFRQSSKPNGPTDRRSGSSMSEFGDEPSEESLPKKGASLNNDDSKPFPLGRSNRAGGALNGAAQSQQGVDASQAGSESVQRGTQKPSVGANPRSPGSSTADRNAPGQRSSVSGDMRHHKRRYTMPRSGIGLEKAITIRVWPNRLLVGGEYEIPVDTSVRTESLVERVLMALDREQASWPSAGVGYHWVPTLKYEVAPGGDQVHERLNSALFDLGLVSSVTYLDADPDAASKPNRPATPKKVNNKSNDESSTPSRETSRARATGAVGNGSGIVNVKSVVGGTR